MRRILAVLGTLALGCAVADDARDVTVRSVFARADEPLARTRPTLLAGRYARMAASPVAFYRGQIALFLADWRDPSTGLAGSSFVGDGPMPFGVGDPHVENFGTLVGPGGEVTLEVNDLDGADRVPLLWDLRRLTIGLAVAARAGNEGAGEARRVLAVAAGDAVRAAVTAYVDGLGGAADASAGAPQGAVLDDLFRRARRDVAARAELGERTVLRDGVRRLVRGGIDAADPGQVQSSLPSWAVGSLPALFAAYRSTLASPPDAGFFTVLDAVREFGSGVASLPRVRVVALVRGPSDAAEDDVLLEVKEQGDAVTPGAAPPAVAAESVPRRVLAARAVVWSRPDADPLWGTAEWFGVPVQVRQVSEGAKSLRVARLTGDLGTPAALAALARVLGARLAQVHRRTLPSPSATGAALVAAREAFAQEEAAVATAYAARVFDDHARFARLLRAQGPTLGFPTDPTDAPSAPVAALFGAPP